MSDRELPYRCADCGKFKKQEDLHLIQPFTMMTAEPCDPEEPALVCCKCKDED